MIKVRNRIICTFVMIIAMTLYFGMVAEATTTQEQINQTQGKLDEANETLNQLREEQAKQNEELSNMNTQMDSISNKIAGLQSQISDTQADIDKLSEEIDLLSADIEEQYNNMKLRIKFMYENGTHSAIDMILSATDFKDLLSKSEYVYQITKYDNVMMGNLNDAMNLLAQTKASVEEDMAELNNLKTDASNESDNLKSLIFNMQNQIDINSTNIEETEALCKKYEEQLEKEKLEYLMSLGEGVDSKYVDGGKPIPYTADDLAMLGAIVECEAGNPPYAGKLAVASVVCNRVNNPRFDNTVSEVILAPKQFSPVTSGRFAIVLARGANAECLKAAKQALEGGINVDSLYFIAYRGPQDDNKLKIGDHVFFSDWKLY